MSPESIFQTPDPLAVAQDGDDLYEVSCTIPDIGASSPEQAASIFYRILAVDRVELYMQVRNERTNETVTVDAEVPE